MLELVSSFFPPRSRASRSEQAHSSRNAGGYRRVSIVAAGSLLAVAACLSALGGASCTVFSGVTFKPSVDASPDGASDLPGLLSLTEAAQVCSKVLTCPHAGPSLAASFGLPIDSANYSQCVHTLSGPIDPQRINPTTSARLRCMANASGCAIGDCVMGEEVDLTDPRLPTNCGDPDAGPTEHCDGDVRISCERSILSSGGWVIHCTDPTYAANSHCQEGGGVTRCVVSTTGCPAVAHCIDGSEAQSMSDGCVDAGGGISAHVQSDCRISGLACQANVFGCAAPPCGIHLQTQCADSTKASICLFNKLTELDCAAAGATSSCKAAGISAYCQGPAHDCTPYDSPLADGGGVNACDGAAINLCVGGKLRSFDCREANPAFTCHPAVSPRTAYCAL